MSKENYDEYGREQVKLWYALKVYSGWEFKLRERLKNVAKNDLYKNHIFRVCVASEDYQDSKGETKERIIKEHKDYVYIEMILNNDTYHAVKIGGVVNFMGLPTSLAEYEIKEVLMKTNETWQGEPFKPKEAVRVITKEDPSLYYQDGKISSVIGENEVNVKLRINEKWTEKTFRSSEIGRLV